MILYALFPLIYNYYKRIKVRPWLIFIFCFVVFLLNYFFWQFFDGLHISDLYFHKSYFFYFSFINQLPSFVLGLYMYSLYITSDESSSHPKAFFYPLFFIAFGLLLFFKYGDYEYRDTLTPFLVGLSFVYLFELTRRLFQRSSVVTGALMKVGARSYGMYLLNTFIAWEISAVLHKALTGYIDDNLLYIIWLPFATVILFVISIYYEKVISRFSKLVFK